MLTANAQSDFAPPSTVHQSPSTFVPLHRPPSPFPLLETLRLGRAHTAVMRLTHHRTYQLLPSAGSFEVDQGRKCACRQILRVAIFVVTVKSQRPERFVDDTIFGMNERHPSRPLSIIRDRALAQIAVDLRIITGEAVSAVVAVAYHHVLDTARSHEQTVGSPAERVNLTAWADVRSSGAVIAVVARHAVTVMHHVEPGVVGLVAIARVQDDWRNHLVARCFTSDRSLLRRIHLTGAIRLAMSGRVFLHRRRCSVRCTFDHIDRVLQQLCDFGPELRPPLRFRVRRLIHIAHAAPFFGSSHHQASIVRLLEDLRCDRLLSLFLEQMVEDVCTRQWHNLMELFVE